MRVNSVALMDFAASLSGPIPAMDVMVHLEDLECTSVLKTQYSVHKLIK